MIQKTITNTQVEAVRTIAERIHENNRVAGWWDKPRNVGEMLMLVVSEVSEAMEGDRKGLNDDHLPERKMIEVELADAMIRILDVSAGLGLDVAGAMQAKIDYNISRADHQRENRERAGGKKY